MAKEVKKKLKLQIPAGKATPAPPIGPALGQAGINIGEFVTRFNEGTSQMGGDIIPVEVLVYEDKSFDLNYKTPPASSLILKAIGKEKGAANPLTTKVGTITKDQIKEIAERKMEDLNAHDVDQASKIIAGTARSMGVEVK
ncbi:MAG: 50S ribosomal protein L11 [Candidatus Paceibacterota bacterium]